MSDHQGERARERLRRFIGAAVSDDGEGRSAAAGRRAEKKKKESVTVAEQLVRLAYRHYRLGRTERDEPFAVPLNGPNVASLLRGDGDALRARLAKLYRQATGRTPGAGAIADALTALAGEALDAAAEPVHLRLAAHAGGVVIDLGDAAGRAVAVRPGGWEVVERSPVLFRRTPLTGAMPVPERGGALADLRALLNVADDGWPLLLGWLLAALLPGIPHPVLLLSGIQGTGKSCAARALAMLVDPSPAPLRSEPRDLEQWAVTASGSWLVAIDNVSGIAPWFSDALCRAVTGDGMVRRALYTDSALSVLAFRRVVLLTSIDPGALRGDLGDRLLLADLDPIPEDARRTEQELEGLFAARRPRLLGALLDALAAVLAELPRLRPGRLPRMADFGRVLAAADAAGVTQGALERYLGQGGRIAAEVVEGDPFAAALVEFLRLRDAWQGTASELLDELLPGAGDRLPPGWPRRNGIRGRLKRLVPALAAQGIMVAWEREGHERRRVIHLRSESTRKTSSASSASSAAAKNSWFCADDPGPYIVR